MAKEIEQKELDNSLKLIAKSSILVLFGAIFSKLLNYIYRVIIARYFGPEVYGLFSLGVMISLIAMAIASLGLFDGILRFTSFYRGENDVKKIKYIVKISSIILLITGSIATLVLYFLSDFIAIGFFKNPSLSIFIKIFGIITPITIFLYLFLAIIQAYERVIAYTVIIDFLENIIKVLFLIILIFIGLKTNAVIFSYSLGLVAVFFIAFIYIKYKIPEIFATQNLEPALRKELKKELFAYSWPLTLSTIIAGFLSYIDSFVIGTFMENGTYYVGIYNAALPIAALMIIAPGLFGRLFLPMITREFSRKNMHMVKELSKQTQKWILIINMPVFVLIMLFPGAFINLLFGSEYLAAENTLRFLTMSLFSLSLSLILNSILTMAGKSKIILSNMIFLVVFNLILDILLVSKYGISGVAFATMISYLALFFILLFEVNYFSSIIPLRRKMLGVIFSAIPPTLALIYIRNFLTINLLTIIFQIIFFTLIYFIMILITKSLDKNDIMILKSFKDKLFIKRNDKNSIKNN